MKNNKVTRRRFLSRSATAGAAASIASLSPASHAGLFTPTRRSRQKAVVVYQYPVRCLAMPAFHR